MRTFLPVLISVILSVVVSYALLKPQQPAATVTAEVKAQSVYDRVTKSKTLRCGWTSFPPLQFKDSNTGEMKGLYVEMTEQLARDHDWKVIWTEEVAATDAVAALNANRVDMMCGPYVPVAQRTQWSYFSIPHFFAPFRAYVRIDDTRFDASRATMNSPDTRISILEGEITSILARTLFPKAKVTELSAAQGMTMALQNVVTKKADIIFSDPFTFGMFDQSNPGTLRQVKGEDIGFFSANYMIKMGEDDFKWVIDSGLHELLNRGYIEKLANDYHLLEAGIYLPADGFKK